ncbi:MAG: hypothetical protein IPK13_21950 [Deltaproteobacteria bacterium]|nr:hypothetical protein [Deltaproteobacteria bacterium]
MGERKLSVAVTRAPRMRAVRRAHWGSAGLVLSLLGASCVGPSRAEMQEREMEARRIMRAKAVHMPPKGVDPCVGVTVRLTEDNDEARAERALFASRIDDDAVNALVDAAGLDRCRAAYQEGIETGGLSPEVLLLKLGYAVDPEGRVCAVVERQREDPLDTGAIPLIEDVARCAKDVLFSVQFPKGLVKERERIVRFLSLKVDPLTAEAGKEAPSSPPASSSASPSPSPSPSDD